MHSFFRRSAMIVVPCALVLAVCIQLHLRQLQHRAERLHAEVLALQLQPGNFADVQRLQREWGAFGHYKGTCTAHHCIYRIELADFLMSRTGWFWLSPTAPPWLQHLSGIAWFGWGYRLLGGRPAVISANVQVRDDRMWGASFEVMTSAYPGDRRSADGLSSGRNGGHQYFVMAAVDWGSRLGFGDGSFNLATLNRGFRTGYEMQCLGCETVSAVITQQASREQIERLNKFNLGCISRLWTCRHPADLAPGLWEAARRDEASSRDVKGDDAQYCQVAIPVLVRESNDVLLAEVLSVQPKANVNEPETTVRILKAVKNGRQTLPGTTLTFLSEPKPAYASGEEALVVGRRYFILYDQPEPDDGISGIQVFPLETELRSCHGVPDTPANEAEVMAGLKLDPSAGEQYAPWSD